MTSVAVTMSLTVIVVGGAVMVDVNVSITAESVTVIVGASRRNG